MSAFGGKADMRDCNAKCPLMTKADIEMRLILSEVRPFLVCRNRRAFWGYNSVISIEYRAKRAIARCENPDKATGNFVGYVQDILKGPRGMVLPEKQQGAPLMSKVFSFLKDESGATAIEYGLIAAGISVVIIATVNTIGTTLNGKFSSISTQLK